MIVFADCRSSSTCLGIARVYERWRDLCSLLSSNSLPASRSSKPTREPRTNFSPTSAIMQMWYPQEGPYAEDDGDGYMLMVPHFAANEHNRPYTANELNPTRWTRGFGFHKRDPYTGVLVPQRHKPGHKVKHYYVQPHDGKRRGKFGQLRDILTGEGPDMFVASVADKRNFWHDMPDRARWSGWTGPDYDELWAEKECGYRPKPHQVEMRESGS